MGTPEAIIAEADRLIARRSSIFFTVLTAEKIEEAAELYAKAARQLKLAKAWNRSAQAYLKASECYGKLGKHYNLNKCISYEAAAHCFENDNNQPMCINWLENAAKTHSLNDRVVQAAKIYESISVKYQRANTLESNAEAIKFVQQAIDLYETEQNTNMSLRRCRSMLAHLLACVAQYTDAAKVFEALAENADKYFVKDFYFKAALCLIAAGDDVAIAQALKKYANDCAMFAGSKEHNLVVQIMEVQDGDEFVDLIKEYAAVSCLDDWLVRLLKIGRAHV